MIEIDSQILNPETQRQHLRSLQEEGLASFYIATSLIGLGLIFVTFTSMALWPIGLIGLVLIFFPMIVRKFLADHFLPQAWILLCLWVGGIFVAAGGQQNSSLLFLLVFPVVLAVLLISTYAANLVAFGVIAILALSTRLYALPLVVDWTTLFILLWGSLFITRLAMHPVLSTMGWSLQNYQTARRELSEARAAQADLKQAIKDLADASTQMARLNQLLATARQTAEEAERTKAEFVANVSHELRTPLNMIIGFSEMMINSSNLYGRIPKALLADLAVILRNSQHLSELINDVLDLSQIEAGKMALSRDQVLLIEIVEAAAVAIRPLFETKKLYLNIDVPDDLIVTCDRTRIREVLLNLLSNAGRFVEKGGVKLQAQVEASQVVISVADTGPGISDQDQARLFQPFQQADGTIRRRYGGTGLGLSISRHFVDLHNGRMWLESEIGRGTTIYFSLPFTPSAAPKSPYDRWNVAEWEYRQRTRRWMAPRLKVHPRLVLLEKGDQFQRLLHRYLGDVDVVSVHSLEDAAVELERAGAQALLVNDFEIDRTIESLWERNLLPSGISAMVCGIHGSEEAAKDLGAEAYLVKPVSQEALLNTLDRLQITSGTILIVDDERDAIQLFWRMLASSNRGYRVLTASNGEEAIGLLSSERLDVILLDLTMPTMDGFQFLAWLREQPAWQNVPVIIMSARDPEGHPVAAGSIGITRGGGLTISQIISFLETVCGPLTITEQSGDLTSLKDPSD